MELFKELNSFSEEDILEVELCLNEKYLDKILIKKHLNELFEKEEWDKIISIVTNFPLSEIHDQKILNDLAVAYWNQNLFDEAFYVCKLLYKRYPKVDIVLQEKGVGVRYMEHHLILGKLCYQRGMYRAAHKIFSKLKLINHFPEKHLFLAGIYYIGKTPGKALSELSFLCKSNTEYFEEVQEFLEEIGKKYPFCEKVYDVKYTLLSSNKKLSSFIKGFKRKVSNEKTLNDIYLLGNFLRCSGHYQDSKKYFDTQLKKRPGNPNLLFFKASSLFKLGFVKQGLGILIEIVQSNKSIIPFIVEKVEELPRAVCNNEINLKYLFQFYSVIGDTKKSTKILEILNQFNEKRSNYNDNNDENDEESNKEENDIVSNEEENKVVSNKHKNEYEENKVVSNKEENEYEENEVVSNKEDSLSDKYGDIVIPEFSRDKSVEEDLSMAGKLTSDIKPFIEKNTRELSALKGNLLSSQKGGALKNLLVTSSTPGEGKTVTAISIAYALAETRAKVLLIDGNLRCPSIHTHFNLDLTPGLSDVFLSDAKFTEVIKATELKNLSVMSAGTKIYHSVDVFNADSFEEKLNYLKDHFDYVILDGHSILVSSDVSMVANYFDGIVLVVECEKTSGDVFEKAKKKINMIGGNIVGIVLNRRQYYIPKKFYKWFQ